jgi:glucose/arabinose dehydrogenase
VTRRPALPRILAIATTAAVFLAACAGDDDATDGASFGSGPSPANATATSGPPVSTTPPPSATDATTPGTVSTVTVPTTTAVTGPLPEPRVQLFEIGTFDQPVEVAHRLGDGQLYVVEQPGRVVAVTDLSQEVVLDISDRTVARGEQGLLGLAFHPTADLAYVHFTDVGGDTVVAELAIDPMTGVFDPAAYRELLTVAQPYANHNGGQLAFGPDQLLYIGLGDGGSGGDPERYSLDLSSPLGKILRIDPTPSADRPYTVPADNPFVDVAGADPRVWSYGLRNPWRFSFDFPTGDLWVPDVGQNAWEEINRSLATDRMNAARGVNFGWSAFEGFERFNTDQPVEGAVDPLFVYDHGDGRCSISGGAVARGDAVPDLLGWYVFGDYCTGQIWGLDPTVDPSQPRTIELAQLPTLVAISEGPDRDLYAVSNAGSVARLIAVP